MASTLNPWLDYVGRLEADGRSKVRALAQIIHCVESARASGAPVDGDRILELATAAAPYTRARQPTNPSTLISMGVLDA